MMHKADSELHEVVVPHAFCPIDPWSSLLQYCTIQHHSVVRRSAMQVEVGGKAKVESHFEVHVGKARRNS